jgi:hypothetical protein
MEFGQQAAQRQTKASGVQQLSPEVKAQAMAAGRPAAQLIEQATQHRTQAPAAPTSQSDGKEALRHNQSSVQKTQAPMSPTDGHKGHAHTRGGIER